MAPRMAIQSILDSEKEKFTIDQFEDESEYDSEWNGHDY